MTMSNESRDLHVMVERLATDYEPDTGIGPIVTAVAQARETIDLLAIDERDGRLPLLERVARRQLDLLTGRCEDSARLTPVRRTPRRAQVAVVSD